MGELTSDLIQWVIADQKVSQKWKHLAHRLGLQDYIVDIDCGRIGGHNRLRSRSDSHKLGTLMKVWRDKRSDSYNVNVLKNVLAAEGLHDMWMWINTLTSKESPLKIEASEAVYSRVSTPQFSPDLRASRSTSPWSTHLYSPPTYSPYSTFFRNTGGSSTGHDFSTIRSVSSELLSELSSNYSSRPPSQISEYPNTSRTNSQLSDNKPWSGNLSCPTSPITNRRYNNTDSLTSPGRIRPSHSKPTTPYRSTNSNRHGHSHARGVYDLLYKPDLIKLSSPLHFRQAQSQIEHQSVRKDDNCIINTENQFKNHKNQTKLEGRVNSPKTFTESDSNIKPYIDKKLYTSHKEIIFDKGLSNKNEDKENDLLTTGDILSMCDNLLDDINSYSEETVKNKNIEKKENGEDMYAKINKVQHKSGEMYDKNTNWDKTNNTNMCMSEGNTGQRDLEVHQSENYRKSFRLPSPRRGKNNTYEEYFDNLLVMIEHTVKDLTE